MHRTRRRAALVSLVCGVLSCGGKESTGADLVGFYCGGIGGMSCPPLSTCPPSTTKIDDDFIPCHATQTCDATHPCPLTTHRCNESGYCVPARLCKKKADCTGDDFCVSSAMSQGYCAPIPKAPETCTKSDDCPWPWWCSGKTCALSCESGDCPSPLRCVSFNCVP